MAKRTCIYVLNAAFLASCCWRPLSAQSAQTIQQEDFGKTPEGQQVYLYTLKNGSGMEVKITNYGARITSIKVMDRNKKFDDVVLGFDNLEGYMSNKRSLLWRGCGPLRESYREWHVYAGWPAVSHTAE